MAVRQFQHSTRAPALHPPVVDRLAGAGGLFFVATLVVQNLLRAAAPGFGASPTTVSDYFAHHRAVVLIPLGLFPLGMFGLLAFTAGVWNRAQRNDGRWWAHLGALGVAAIAALFALVNITEIVLAAKGPALVGSAAVVRALWATHAAAFGLVLAAQAVALVGLSRAAITDDLIPRWLGPAAIGGSACLLTTAVFTVAIAEGAPWVALGLAGFAVWGVFIAVAGYALVRRSQ